MKFQANSKNLLAAVTAASAAVAARNVIPVLECLLIRAADNTLTLTGTNLDTQITATCEAAVSAPGVLAVNADDLKRFLAALPSTTVSAEGADRLVLTGGRARIELIGFPEADFPLTMPGEAPHEIEGAAEAVAWCGGFAPQNEARFFLNGIKFGAAGTIATGGVTAGICPITSEVEAIVPSTALRQIAPIMKSGGRMFLGEDVWRVEAKGITAKGKLIAGSYPDWTRIVPARLDLFTADADEAIAAVKQATIDKASRVILRAAGEAITVTGEGYDRSSAVGQAEFRAEVAMEFSGCFGAKPLLAILSALSGSVIEGWGADGAICLTAPGRPDWRVLVAAIRHEVNKFPSARIAA